MSYSNDPGWPMPSGSWMPIEYDGFVRVVRPPDMAPGQHRPIPVTKDTIVKCKHCDVPQPIENGTCNRCGAALPMPSE